MNGWLDPNPLSQIVGALIGALIAIGLWRAEKRRNERERIEEERRRSERFRLTLKSATSRVAKEIDLFQLQKELTLAELEEKAKSEQPTDEGWRSVISLVDRFPVNIPNSFEFSELHAYALTEAQADALSAAKDELQDLFIHLRALRDEAQKRAGSNALAALVVEAGEYAGGALVKLRTLETSLAEGKT